jgi:hypothetical protein
MADLDGGSILAQIGTFQRHKEGVKVLFHGFANLIFDI